MRKALRSGLFLGIALLAAIGRSEGRAQAAAGITIQKDVMVGAKHCDQVSWTDANGKARSVWLVRANGDPGYSGGYVERYSYYVDNTLKTGQADAGQAFVSGLGCAVNHHSTASSSKANSTGATTGFVLEGANHVVWRFHSSYSGDGHTVGLTIDWVISQGRNDVLWAVSYDATGQGSFDWDARGPYFQFDWDGDGHFYDAAISGIKWGDKYRFRTTTYSGATSDWDYTQTNVIPYMSTYKSGAAGDLEAGVVQTQPWTQQDAGGYWWADTAWGKTSANYPVGSQAMPVKGMPVNWDCPYQLNAYENYGGEKLAWGTNFGFVGNPNYQRLGYTAPPAPGAPHQGYSTFIILNKYSQGLTDATIVSMESVQATTLTASTGTVVTQGPRHANLTGDAAYQPAGWNHVYGVWSVNAGAGNAAAFNFNVASGTLLRPTVVLNNFTGAAPATLMLGGTTLNAGTDFTASVDAAKQQLWLTLQRNVSGASNAVTLGAAAPAPPAPVPPAPAPSSAKEEGGGDSKCGCGTGSTPSGAWIAGAALLALLLAGRP